METSTTLADPWTPGTPAGSVTTDIDNVKYPFPAGTKNFVRLRVTVP